MNISESLRKFIGDKMEQFDDITMPAVKQRDKYMELSCDLSQLKKIRECVFGLSVEDTIKKKIFLACEEIFSNIANYSGADCVQFGCNKNEDKINVIFIDNGQVFNPHESKIEKDFEDFDEGGMGISLVKQLCSDISYRNTDGKNILSLEFMEK